MSILLFGFIRLIKYVFIFVEFGVEIGIVSVFLVLNVYCKSCLVWFINLMNNGLRWFRVGFVMVFKILGLILDGFGFIKVCLGGIKVENDCIIYFCINVRVCF